MWLDFHGIERVFWVGFRPTHFAGQWRPRRGTEAIQKISYEFQHTYQIMKYRITPLNIICAIIVVYDLYLFIATKSIDAIISRAYLIPIIVIGIIIDYVLQYIIKKKSLAICCRNCVSNFAICDKSTTLIQPRSRHRAWCYVGRHAFPHLCNAISYSSDTLSLFSFCTYLHL